MTDSKSSTISHLIPGSLSELQLKYTQTASFRVPHDELKRNKIVTGEEKSVSAAEYKMLRTRVSRRMKVNGWNTLAVTSPGQGEGKTLTSVNLAISMAMEIDQSVLLVDLDLRRPSVARYFNCNPPAGISDYFRLDVPIGDILFNPGIDRLVILPGSERVENSSEILSSPKMIQLIEEIKSRYSRRRIIFDLPPVLITDDALAFSPYVDAMLLVIEDGKTKKSELSRAVDLLESSNILGVVVNKAKTQNQEVYY
jgi:capsular exopolysaccharide synthesis family protein